MCAILEREALVAVTFATLTACTTAQEVRRPNGDIEYVIGCGAGTGWNVCYGRGKTPWPEPVSMLKFPLEQCLMSPCNRLHLIGRQCTKTFPKNVGREKENDDRKVSELQN